MYLGVLSICGFHFRFEGEVLLLQATGERHVAHFVLPKLLFKFVLQLGNLETIARIQPQSGTVDTLSTLVTESTRNRISRSPEILYSN